MQRSGSTPTQNAAPFFSTLFGGGRGNTTNTNTSNDLGSSPSGKSPARSRPPTSVGEESPRQKNVLRKDRKPSFGRKPSFSWTSPGRGSKSRADSSSSANGDGVPGFRPPAVQLFPDPNPVPPLPDFALASAAHISRETDAIAPSPASSESFSLKMLSRGAPTPINGYPVQLPPSISMGGGGAMSELSSVHQHIQETVNKRISTLDYLRKV
jgi:hypothetical protein